MNKQIRLVCIRFTVRQYVFVSVEKWKYSKNSDWRAKWECFISIFQIFMESSEKFRYSHWGVSFGIFFSSSASYISVLVSLSIYLSISWYVSIFKSIGLRVLNQTVYMLNQYAKKQFQNEIQSFESNLWNWISITWHCVTIKTRIYL